jgi:subtilase family serine protease
MLRRFAIAIGAIGMLAAVPAVQAAATPAAHAPATHAARVCPRSTSATRFECFAMVKTDASGRPLVSPNASPTGYGPDQFHTGYNLPTTAATDQTVAIVDAFSNPDVMKDLRQYDLQYGLPTFPKCSQTVTTSCIDIVNQQGKKSPLPRGDTGWGLEISLDVQTVHAICQNCRIELVEATSNSNANLAAGVNTAANKLHANAISNSYGSFLSDCTQTGYNHPNVAVTVSAGDYGYGIACPAVENTVVSIGGTTLNLNPDNTYQSESVWDGTGSGCSTHNSAQSWQTSASNWAAIACTGRGMNDVSADADPDTGASVYDTYGYGGWLTVGGTSLSSPLIAAVYALAGNASTWAYPAQSVYLSTGSLHDVTTGSNGSCGTHTLRCTAGVGYDLPTGIGTPNGLGGF